MVNFHKIVRGWCQIYKSMLDNPYNGNRRFYLTDSTAGVVEMAKGIANKFSPFVMMESGVEMEGDFTKPFRNYPIYFFVRAEKMADGDEAALAYEEALLHAKKFLTWLWNKHQKEMSENTGGDFAMLDLEQSRLLVSSVGPLENGWFGVCVQFDRMEPLNLCDNPDDYMPDDFVPTKNGPRPMDFIGGEDDPGDYIGDGQGNEESKVKSEE